MMIRELNVASLDAACGGATNTYSFNGGGNSVHVVQSGGSNSLSVNGQNIYGSDFDPSDFPTPATSELAGYDFAGDDFEMPDLPSFLKF